MCLSSPKMPPPPVVPPPPIPPTPTLSTDKKLRNPRAAGVSASGQRRRRGKAALTIPLTNPRINTPT